MQRVLQATTTLARAIEYTRHRVAIGTNEHRRLSRPPSQLEAWRSTALAWQLLPLLSSPLP